MATKAPSGLAIKRSGSKFTVTWKIADKEYDDGQQFKHRTRYATVNGIKLEQHASAEQSETVTKKQTTKSVTINFNNYYPHTKKNLTAVQFAVRGNRKSTIVKGSGKLRSEEIPGWSTWADKDFLIYEPNKPTLSASLDSQLWNKTTFSWAYSDDTSSHRPFDSIEWQSMLVKDCKETNGKYLNWSSGRTDYRHGTTGASGSIPITEDTTLISGKSYTRWVRARARGAGGASDWVYAKHVYAQPYQAFISKAIAKPVTAGTSFEVVWESTSNASRPIDFSTVQYVIETPLAGLQCPTGLSWTDALVVSDKTGKANFVANVSLNPDECLWVRVNNQHDEQLITEGTPKLAMTGSLSAPSNLSVDIGNTYQATVTATNESAVPDSFLAITYKEEGKTPFIIGIIPHGSTSATVQAPDTTGRTVDFGVFAVQGTYTQKTRADGVTQYVITKNMTSATVWDGGTIPSAPTLTGSLLTSGAVRLTWDWTWSEATGAEISWADHDDAWESTDEPQTYEVASINTANWNVANLEEGRVWYFRIRLYKETDGETTYGRYSDIISVNLSSAPLVPSLTLSQPVITEAGQVTASWAYVSTDGTNQGYAEICEFTTTYSEPIATVETAQHITLYAEDYDWASGNIYNLCVRVTSASGQQSEWSDPVPITIAEPLTIGMTSSLTTGTLDEETVTILESLPLTVTVTGAGEGTTTVAIERLEGYFMDKPDESTFEGFKGETVALITQTGEDTITIDRSTLYGSLDDGAWYTLIGTIEDGFGQTAKTEVNFLVKWSHQAEIPEGTVTLDGDIAKIVVASPSGAETGDTADIYRLSTDKPELIYQGAEYGTTYVDPYPTIGGNGGYRIVMITKDGDYITDENQPAWTDYYTEWSTPYSIIDFDGDKVYVLLNQNLSSTWTKDFKETQYLGGAVQGDWNRAVSRAGSVNTYAIKVDDAETIRKMRRLAVWTGICHVRTVDGSSYAADVQVTEDYSYDNFAAAFNLKITRVDPEGLEGLPLTEWEVEE